jgi:ADP-ribose pyrophosphatase YjhB (NUDIX family)
LNQGDIADRAHLNDPIGDGVWRRGLMALVRFRAWLLGSVYTAGSLVLLLRDDGSVLLVKPWYRRGWGLPGGSMRHREQSSDTLLRELHEETGLTVEVDNAHDVYVQRNRRHIDHLYVVRVTIAHDLQPRAGREIREAAWYPLDNLPPLQHEAHEALGRVKLF